MAKKKQTKTLTFLKPSWLTVLFLGVAIGIASQQIQQLRAYTNEFIQPAEHPFAQSPVPGHPTSSFIIHRPNYTLEFDASRRVPKWTFEHLTAASLEKNVDRSNFDFIEDEALPQHLRSTLADYRGSGYDRGHSACAANHRSSAEAMAGTFYLSNICPQNPACNRGHWAQLERYARDLTRDYENVYVLSGPLYLPTIEENGKRYVKYEVLGQNNVSVPTHFFKIISLEDAHGNKETQAFILPNEPIAEKTSLDCFKTTVEKVEKCAGIVFAK